MNEAFVYVGDLLHKTFDALILSYQHNWKVLLFAIIIAVALKTYVNAEKLSKLLFKRKRVSIIASVLFGAFTPLCACGTTAVIIGMLTTAMPWGPIMAFLTSSPLMSPDGFLLISGVIGTGFAVALTVASVAIGLGSGFITNIIEKKTNFLKDQTRFSGKEKDSKCGCNNKAEVSACSCGTPEPVSSCSCGTPAPAPTCGCGSKDNNVQAINGKNETGISALIKKFKLKEFSHDFFTLGIKQIFLFYTIFICIGFLINYFVPKEIINALFGADSIFAVPLASLIGLPLYITTDSGIPIINSMIQSGASHGAMLAFMITGSATSVWVIAGLSTFLKKRAIALYVGFVIAGGIISGYVLDFVRLFM